MTTYANDNAGRRIAVSGPGRNETFTYDAEDHMLSATINGKTTRYEYDWQGNKVSSIVEDVRTDYLVDSVSMPYPQVIEERQNGVVKKQLDYNPATSEPLAVTDASSTHAMLTDGQGSVRVMTDPSGQVEGTQDFDAFGVKTAAEGVEIPRGYTGEETSPDGGLVYLRARWMDPQTGRFVSADQARGLVSRPETLHEYTYVANNPINLSDPSGESALPLMITNIAIADILSSSVGSVQQYTRLPAQLASAIVTVDPWLVQSSGWNWPLIQKHLLAADWVWTRPPSPLIGINWNCLRTISYKGWSTIHAGSSDRDMNYLDDVVVDLYMGRPVLIFTERVDKLWGLIPVTALTDSTAHGAALSMTASTNQLTVAHELGHIFGLGMGHEWDRSNLMWYTPKKPDLTQEQKRTALGRILDQGWNQ